MSLWILQKVPWPKLTFFDPSKWKFPNFMKNSYWGLESMWESGLVWLFSTLGHFGCFDSESPKMSNEKKSRFFLLTYFLRSWTFPWHKKHLIYFLKIIDFLSLNFCKILIFHILTILMCKNDAFYFFTGTGGNLRKKQDNPLI